MNFEGVRFKKLAISGVLTQLLLLVGFVVVCGFGFVFFVVGGLFFCCLKRLVLAC